MADDGFYAVKFLQNPQHGRILANEALASELLRRIGIATPEWKAIGIDRAFLHREKTVGFETRQGFVPAEPGLHFGSRFSWDCRADDFAPPSLMDRVLNIDDFFKVLVFDLWVDNRDSRQAIFVGGPNGPVRAQMMDNGFAFGSDGVDHQLRDHCFRSPQYLPLSAYRAPAAAAQYVKAIDRIQNISAEQIILIVNSLPAEWLPDYQQIERLANILQRRSERLPALLRQTLAKFTGISGVAFLTGSAATGALAGNQQVAGQHPIQAEEAAFGGWRGPLSHRRQGRAFS
jgi:hypothetical protein